jgi:hypothetical protein
MEQRAAPYVLAPGQIRSHPGTFPATKAGAADTGGLFTLVGGVIGPRTRGRRCTSTTAKTSACT